MYVRVYKHNNIKRENYTWCFKRLHGIVFLQVVSQRGLIKWILTPFWLKKGTVACNTPCESREEEGRIKKREGKEEKEEEEKGTKGGKV